MKNKKYQLIYEKAKQIEEKYNKEDYERLTKIDNAIGSYEEYLKKKQKELKKYNNIERTEEKQQQIDNVIICKDIINRENLTFNLYLCRFNHILPPKLEDYKVKPIEKINYYEYGCILEYNDNNINYKLNNIFTGIDEDEHFAKDKYIALKSKINKDSLDEILDEIEKYLDKFI